MALTQDQLTASMYFIVGLGTEGGSDSYRISVAGLKNGMGAWVASNTSRVKDNSGYTLGALQLDLGQRGPNAVGTVHTAKAGETAYVDAIIAEVKAYSQTQEAKDLGIVFPADTSQLRTQLLTHGNGLLNPKTNKYRTTISFISDSDRDAIDAWAMSEEGMNWLHRNVDLALVKENSEVAFPVVAQFGANWTEQEQWQAANELAKLYNQNKLLFRDLKSALEERSRAAGSVSFSDLQKSITDIQSTTPTIHATAAGAIGGRFYTALQSDGMGDWLDSATQKVMAPDFDPRRLTTDADLILASKVALAGNIGVAKDAAGNTVLTLYKSWTDKKTGQPVTATTASYTFDAASDTINVALYRGGKLVGGTCYAHALTGGTTVVDAAPATRYSYLSASFGSLLTDLENAAATALQKVHADDVIKGVGSLYHSITDIYDQATARIDSLIASARSLFDGIVPQAQAATDASGNSVLKFSYSPGDTASEALLQKVNKLETFWDGLSQEMQQTYGDPGQQFLDLSLDLSSNLPEEKQQATEDLRQLAASALDSAIETFRTQIPGNPPVVITTPRNQEIFKLSVDPATLKPTSPDALGTSSGGWGLLRAGSAYQASMAEQYVNEGGWADTCPSNQVAGDIRPGDHCQSNVVAFINALRAQTTQQSANVLLPDGVASSDFGEVYHGNGSTLHPTYGINLYNATGQAIGFIATDSDPILQNRNGTLVQILSPVKGQAYLYSQPGDITQGVRAATAEDGQNLAYIDVPLNAANINQTKNFADDLAYTDPLTLDGDNDGVRLSTNPVNFDLNADGVAESLPWTAPTDPLLVMDVNGNGRIDNGSELLDLTNADAPLNLLTLDDNGDKKLDANDAAYWNLELWSDRNQDGYASAEERQSLSDLGIVSIDLDPNNVKTGTVAGQSNVKGVVATDSDGSTRTLWDVQLTASTANPTTTTVYAPGIDRVSGSGQVALVARSALGIALNLNGSGADQAIGGQGNDTLTGTGGDDWLIGGAGADQFAGGAGADLLVIDADDRPSAIDGGAGIDTVLIADDRGILLNLAQANIEVVYGGYGNDVFIGGGADNVFISGAAGDDLIVGGSVDDVLSGEDGDDVIEGGKGDDLMRGGRGEDQLYGGESNDVLDGGLGNDHLNGEAGNDVLIASGGEDTVDGGAGIDLIELKGGLEDYRLVKNADGSFTITDHRNEDGSTVDANEVSNRNGIQHVSNVEKFSFMRGQTSTAMDFNRVEPLPVDDRVAVSGTGNTYSIAVSALLGNDVDFQGGALNVYWVGDAVGGTATLSADKKSVTFTPQAGYSGPLEFAYKVKDAQGHAAPVIANVADPTISGEMKGKVLLVPSDAPSDPDFAKQWYLGAIGAMKVWQDGYTGKGVKVLVLEPSGEFAVDTQVADLNLSDLKPNKSTNFQDTTVHSTHATAVAGVIGAARNGIGGVGVAYGATLDSKAFSPNSSVVGMRNLMAQMANYDIVNNSWGHLNPWNYAKLTSGAAAEQAYDAETIKAAAEKGRAGLGTVMVFANGNDRAKGYDSGLSSLTNNAYTINVAAVNRVSDIGAGEAPVKPFSERGANILVTAPGSDIVTTGVQFETANGSTVGTTSTETQGASFAAPIVSGVVALMLQANPKLSYRDVQTILALTARKNLGSDTQASTTWYTNHDTDWNGAGMHYSDDFGFGMVDAAAAVRMAENWQTLGGVYSSAVASGDEPCVTGAAVSDLGRTVLTLTVSESVDIEQVITHLTLNHARWGDLVVTLVSPSGTQSILLDRAGVQNGTTFETNPAGETCLTTDLMSTHFRGENSVGENGIGIWQLIVEDKAAGVGGTGTITASLEIHGDKETIKRYILTDDYAGGWNLTPDAAKPSELNAAALSTGARIDLSGTTVGLVNGKAFTVAPGIDRLIGGGGADTLTGSDNVETILGGDGDDLVSGGGDNDWLEGGRGDDSLYGGGGNDVLVVAAGNDRLTGNSGADVFLVDVDTASTATIADFSAINGDRLVLRTLGTPLLRAGIQQQLVNDNLVLTVPTANGNRTVTLEGVSTALDATQLKLFGQGDEVSVYPDGEFTVDRRIVYVKPEADIIAPQLIGRRAYNDEITGQIKVEDIYSNGGRYTLGKIGWTQGSDRDELLLSTPLPGNSPDSSKISQSEWECAVANAGPRCYDAGGGNDEILGDSTNEILDGGSGDDTLNGGGGDDALTGGLGTDTFVFASDFGNDTITDLGDTDVLSFQNGIGAINSKTVYSNASVDGFDVRTTLISGSDIVTFVRHYRTTQLENADITLFTAQLANNATVVPVLTGKAITNGDDVIVQKKAGRSIDAQGGNDILYATTDTNCTVQGGSGNDTIYALAGGAYIDGGADNDAVDVQTVSVIMTTDTVVGGLGQDTIRVGAHDAVIYGDLLGDLASGDADRVFAGAGNDTVHGGGGNDTLFGEAGNDQIFGDVGNDVIQSGDGADTLYGCDGNDILDGAVDNDFLYGDIGNDTLTGGTGDDALYGGDDGDLLMGGDGNDLLVGGVGDDYFTTGSGSDTIFLDMSSGNDAVDGLAGVDTVRIQGLSISATATVSAIRQALVFSLLDNGARVKLTWGGSNSLTLSSYNLTTKFEFDNGAGGYTTATLTDIFNWNDYHPGTSFDFLGVYDTQLEGDPNKVATLLGGTGDDELYGGPVVSTDPAYWYIVGRNGNDTLAGEGAQSELIAGAIIDGGYGSDKLLGSNGVALLRDTFHGGQDTLVMPAGITPESLRFYRIPNPVQAQTMRQQRGSYVAAPSIGAESKLGNPMLPSTAASHGNAGNLYDVNADTLRIQSVDGKLTVDIVGYFDSGVAQNDVQNIEFMTVFDAQGNPVTRNLDAFIGNTVKGGVYKVKDSTPSQLATFTDYNIYNYYSHSYLVDSVYNTDCRLIIGGDSDAYLQGNVKVFTSTIFSGQWRDTTESKIVTASQYASFQQNYRTDESTSAQTGRLTNGFSTLQNSYYEYADFLSTVAIALPDTIYGGAGNDTIDAGGVYAETQYFNSGQIYASKIPEISHVMPHTGLYPFSWRVRCDFDIVNGGGGDDAYIYKKGYGSLHIVATNGQNGGADGIDTLYLSDYACSAFKIKSGVPSGSYRGIFISPDGSLTITLEYKSVIRVDAGHQGQLQVDRIVFADQVVNVSDLIASSYSFTAVDSRIYQNSVLAPAPENLDRSMSDDAFARLDRGLVSDQLVVGSPIDDLILAPTSGLAQGYEGHDIYIVDTKTTDFVVLAMDRGDGVSFISASSRATALREWEGEIGGTNGVFVTPGAEYLGKTEQQWLDSGVVPMLHNGMLDYIWAETTSADDLHIELGVVARDLGSSTISVADWTPVSDTSDLATDALVSWTTTSGDDRRTHYVVLAGIADSWGNLLVNRSDYWSASEGDLSDFRYELSAAYLTQGDDYITTYEALPLYQDLSYYQTAVTTDIYCLGGNDTVLAYANDWFDETGAYVGSYDILHGGSGNDSLEGGAGDDSLYGGEDDDTVVSGIGSDLLVGGPGYDLLVGGSGDDVYVVDANDIVIENATETISTPDGTSVMVSGGIDEVQGDLDIDLSNAKFANIENGSLLGTTAHVLAGNAGANRLTGNGEGSTLIGGVGDDTYVVDGDSDTIVELAEGGIDTVITRGGITALANNIENLKSGGANLHLIGNRGANQITGDAGDNIIDGVGGVDTLVGGQGNDTYVVYDSGVQIVEKVNEGNHDVVWVTGSYELADGCFLEEMRADSSYGVSMTGNSNDNVLFGGAGEDTLNGGAGEDTLNGGVGNDRFYGDEGGDTLDGGLGADTLDGGTGDDTLDGGFGADTYVINGLGQGDDRILQSGQTEGGNDTIQFSGIQLSEATFELGGWEPGSESGEYWTTGLGTSIRITAVSGGKSSSITIDGFFNADGSDATRIDGVQFDDITLDFAQIKARTLVQASVGADQLYGFSLAELIDGGKGNDTIYGGGGNDTLIGGLGNDSIFGSGTLDGGEGDDSLQVNGDSRSPTRLVGGAGDDTLMAYDWYCDGTYTFEGGQGNDSLFCVNGQNTVIYRAGDGKDTVSFGDSDHDDVLRIEGLKASQLTFTRNGQNLLIGQLSDPNSQQVVVTSYFTYTTSQPARIEVLNETGAYSNLSATDILALTRLGSPLPDYITGTSSNDVFHGYQGNDLIYGGSGNDTVFGDEGNDILWGDAGNSLLDGGAGNDSLNGGVGNDSLNGGAGIDTLVGGAGDDIYVIDVSDVVTELPGEGVDTVNVSGTGTYTLGDNLEDAKVSGFSTLIGNDADNTLIGSGDMTFDGGKGNDHYISGYSNATYLFGRGSGQDRVLDCDWYDTEDSTTFVDQVSIGSDVATDQLWFKHVGNDLEVSLIGTTDKITIEDWYLSSENHIEQFTSSDNKVLSDTSVESLVQAMASFSPPAAGLSTIPANDPNYQNVLQVVNTSWR